jgi:hypothetical protein
MVGRTVAESFFISETGVHACGVLCDLYLLMEIIRDWADAEALAMLRAVRRAAPPHAKLLVIEELVPEEPEPHWAKTLDIYMLVLPGGRQRSRQEYAALLDSPGFAFKREIDTRAGVAILESVVL